MQNNNYLREQILNKFTTSTSLVSTYKIGEKKSLFLIGTGADIHPQKRSRKITVSVNSILFKRYIIYINNIDSFINFYIFFLIWGRNNFQFETRDVDVVTFMTWLLFFLIMQAEYYAQDTGNQCRILGRLIC
jgi:hypothetical protein